MILPSAAGSSADLLMRILSDELTKRLGHQVVVDNRPGAAGQSAMALVKDASPDGYVIGCGNIGTPSVNPALFEKMPYDPLRDSALVAPVLQVSNIMVVNGNAPYKNVLDVVEAARRQPGKLLFSSTSQGTTSHPSSELLMFQTGTRMVHVQYKGLPQSIADPMAGQVDLTLENMGVLLPHVRSGKLRALVVTGPKRSAARPAVPTMVEAGVPGFEMTAWGGIIAPVKMPAAPVKRMSGEIDKALASQTLRDRYADADSETTGGSPQDFRAFVEHELKRWG
ncbi:MAG: tripartite tricarboxylate transporter substrate binding protein [Betaproteobacteria bacterium]|jgi:tripartite-type tricarboxylate transporter receptor subunit TctC|nr:tripartite tricarboxylate transporter substrate binding protein [Betaproteobacteria bacterium]